MISRMPCALVGAAMVLTLCAAADARAQAAPPFSIDWYFIDSGASRMQGACFVLDGTAGQPAPGYSSGGIYALLSGFWSVAPITGNDEIFFNSFEGCSP